MSLINDALKKAQKQRTGETPTLASMPSVGGESPQRIARRAKPPGFDSLMLRAGIGAAVVLVLGVGGFFLMRDKPSSENVGPPLALPADAKQSAGQTPGSQQGTTVQQPTANNQQPAVQSAPAPTFTLPLAPKSEPLPAVAKQTAGQTPGLQQQTTVPVTSPVGPPLAGAPSSPASQAKAASTAANPQVSLPGDRPGQTPGSQQGTTVQPPPKLDPRAIEYIENIKVAGIRVSATDPKVLMNDRVYRPGSQVSAEFGLTLVEIATGSLTFEDAAGGRYTRTF